MKNELRNHAIFKLIKYFTGGNASAGDSVFAKDAKISRCMEVKRWNINVFFSLYRSTVQMGIFI